MKISLAAAYCYLLRMGSTVSEYSERKGHHLQLYPKNHRKSEALKFEQRKVIISKQKIKTYQFTSKQYNLKPQV